MFLDKKVFILNNHIRMWLTYFILITTNLMIHKTFNILGILYIKSIIMYYDFNLSQWNIIYYYVSLMYIRVEYIINLLLEGAKNG